MIILGQAEDMYEESIRNGGGTYDQYGKRLDFADGYIVATSRFSEFVGDVDKRDDAVSAILSLNRSAPWAFIGTWVHEGKIYIDPVMHVEKEENARACALDYHQKAYYDVKNEKSVFV